MNRLLALLLTCGLLLGMLPAVAFAEEEVTDATQSAVWESVMEEAKFADPSEITDKQADEILSCTLMPTTRSGIVVVYETEPNDTLVNADEAFNDQTVVGALSSYDVDRYRFVLTEESYLIISAASQLDNLYACIFNSEDEIVGLAMPYEYDDGTYTYLLAETYPAGTYYLTVIDGNNVGNNDIYAVAIEWVTHSHNYTIQEVVEPSCTKNGYTVMGCICGKTYNTKPVSANGRHVYDDNVDGTCNDCAVSRETVETRQVTHMFRMYNPNTGEHFYTGSEEEKSNLVEAGWHYEGVGFTFPSNTGAPVHRLFETVSGEHLYTMNEAEKDSLIAAGWNYEGIAFNSAYDTEAVQHRLHNPNATVGAYHFTFSEEEKQNLIHAGWEYQGIGWYSCW